MARALCQTRHSLLIACYSAYSTIKGLIYSQAQCLGVFDGHATSLSDVKDVLVECNACINYCASTAGKTGFVSSSFHSAATPQVSVC